MSSCARHAAPAVHVAPEPSAEPEQIRVVEIRDCPQQVDRAGREIGLGHVHRAKQPCNRSAIGALEGEQCKPRGEEGGRVRA